MDTKTKFEKNIQWLTKQMERINAYCAKNNISIMFDYFGAVLEVYDHPNVTSLKYREDEPHKVLDSKVPCQSIPMCFTEYDADYDLGTLKY